MSRRQSIPANMFYRRADPLPPLFPPPSMGDMYFNTTRNVLRIYQEDHGSSPLTMSWQDLSYAAADHTHASVIDHTWNFDSVSTMADPGAGKLRTNTAAGTPATQIAFSSLTGAGVDASRTIESLVAGDVFYFQEADDAANWGKYEVTAPAVDNGTWDLLAVKGVETQGTTIAKNQTVLIRFTFGTGGGGGGGAGGGATEVHVGPDEPSDIAIKWWLDTNDTTGQETVVPIGSIIMYGGTVAPTGWHLCDGTAHSSAALQAVIGTTTTPDLRDRFIVGAGSAYAQKATGGAATHTLTANEMPSHTHDFLYAGTRSAVYPFTNAFDNNGGIRFSVGSFDGGNDVGIATTGGSAAHNNLPPYYALTYIIKKG